MDPELQDEYLRDGLSDGMLTVVRVSHQAVQQLMTDVGIPGLSLALVDRDGILWSAGFGYADKRKKVPFTTETLSAACSFTKVFTGTAVMFAIQDGLLELDVPIIEYVPDFSVNSRFEENPHEKITLRHLLTHSSGLPRETTVVNFFDLSGASFEEHIKSISDTWLTHKVGERVSYSNIGMDLVAHILEVRTGKSYSEFLGETVFEPLDMFDSSADPAVFRQRRNRAVPYMPHVEVSLEQVEAYRGAGSVFTNAKDLARFIQFHLNHGSVGGQSVLDERLIDLMYTPSPLDPNPWPNHRRDQGLGVWVLTTLKDGNHKVGHDGSGPGLTSQGWWYPEYGFGGLVLARSSDLYQKDEKAWLDNTMKRMIAEKLVERNDDFDTVSWKTEWGSGPTYDSWRDPNAFTPFQPDWKKYTGTYRYRLAGYKLSALVRIATALFGFPPLEVKVRETDGYLEVVHCDLAWTKRHERLDQHLPGLFFTEYGDCLDLRGEIPTWNNFRLKKR
ncbi:MAG: beta-lactamase family protein [Phycisphaerales bacterium]|nr:MAG: beta-lactamase family protein [Phycisphaerales bacterium]